MQPGKRLIGKVALVTGAVGAIGFGVCQKLVAAGAHVLVSDLDAERCVTAGQCRAAPAGQSAASPACSAPSRDRRIRP